MRQVELDILGKENPFELIGQQWMLITVGGKVTLSFFPESCRKALQICGSKSGRDCDKVKEAGLTPVALGDGSMTFEQARLTLACRKLLKTDMKPAEFPDKEVLDKWYSEAGLHSVYVLEIESLWE